MRKKLPALDDAYMVYSEAASLLAGSEFETSTHDILRLVESSQCSAYDCEFVSLAQRLKTIFFLLHFRGGSSFRQGVSSSIPETETALAIDVASKNDAQYPERDSIVVPTGAQISRDTS